MTEFSWRGTTTCRERILEVNLSLRYCWPDDIRDDILARLLAVDADPSDPRRQPTARLKIRSRPMFGEEDRSTRAMAASRLTNSPLLPHR